MQRFCFKNFRCTGSSHAARSKRYSMYWQLQLPRNHMEISFSSYSLRCSFLAWTTKGKGRAWERTAAESARTCRVKQVLCPLELRLRCVRSSVWLVVGVDLLWENITVDWLVAGGWCWFSMRKQYYWLVGWQAKRKHPKILYKKYHIECLDTYMEY